MNATLLRCNGLKTSMMRMALQVLCVTSRPKHAVQALMEKQNWSQTLQGSATMAPYAAAPRPSRRPFCSLPTPSHLVPDSGPVLGSTHVHVYGTGFVDGTDTRCRFGGPFGPGVVDPTDPSSRLAARDPNSTMPVVVVPAAFVSLKSKAPAAWLHPVRLRQLTIWSCALSRPR